MDVKEAARKVFTDLIAFHADKLPPFPVLEGTAPPPVDIEESINYFIAHHAGHYSNYAKLNDYTRRKLYEAINGHRDWTSGTPICQWAVRAKYDEADLKTTFNLAIRLIL